MKDKMKGPLPSGELVSGPNNYLADCKYIPKTTGNKAQIPFPGTALSAYLRKFRQELAPYRDDPHVAQLLAAILLLLNEADQAERGRYER